MSILNNIFRLNILCFGAMFLWNCSSDSEEELIDIFDSSKQYEAISISEAKKVVKDMVSKYENSSLVINNSSLHYRDIENSEVSVPIFFARLNEKVNTKIFMLKKAEEVYTFFYHSIPFQGNYSSDQTFSGDIIISDITNKFIDYP